LAAALAQIGRLDEARSAVKGDLPLNPAFSISRDRADWPSRSDDPTYLAAIEPVLEGLRKAEASLKARSGSGCDAHSLSTGRSIRA
jgi:hypothetical protein